MGLEPTKFKATGERIANAPEMGAVGDFTSYEGEGLVIYKPETLQAVFNAMQQKQPNVSVPNIDQTFWDMFPKGSIPNFVVSQKTTSGNITAKLMSGEPIEIVLIHHSNEVAKGQHSADSIIYHEFAHRLHHVRGIITNTEVDPAFAKVFKAAQESLEGNADKELLKKVFPNSWKRQESRAKKETIHLGLRKISDGLRAKVESRRVLSEQELTNYSMVTQALDTLAALTDGELGGGHSKSYWAKDNTPEKEFFVHAMESYFVGNKIIEELMPEIYEIQKKMH